jgi:hypothetical protein
MSRTGQSPVLIYAAEFKVLYRVGTREFSLWTEGRCVSGDRAWVEKRMAEFEQNRKAVVWYNPSDPGESFAAITGDTPC